MDRENSVRRYDEEFYVPGFTILSVFLAVSVIPLVKFKRNRLQKTPPEESPPE